MHILIYCHEFPNPVEPVKGTFIERPLAFYPEDFEVKVIAPVPWFLSHRRKKKSVKIPLQDSLQTGSKTIEVFRPRYILFPRNFLRGFIGWLEYITTLSAVRKLHKSWKIDIIHAHFAYPDGVAVRHICKKLGLKYVITEHQGAIGTFLKNPILKNQILKVYQDSAKTIAVSEFTKQQILENSTNPLLIEVIPNGVQVDRFELTVKKQVPKNLIFIGNLIYTKGIHLLIQAITNLRKEGITFKLAIIGNGVYKSTLMNIVKRDKMDKSVEFLGTRTANEIAQLLPEYDILVLPSFIESFSVVLIEAMSTGLPVIATKCGGPEYIVTPETGVLINPYSTEEIASALLMMLKDWQKYDPLVISTYAKEKFNIVSIVQRICSIYTEIIGSEENHEKR